jgi:hypothetical protein
MIGRVEHELHGRRRGRNFWLGGILLTFVLLVFSVTLVKLKSGQSMEAFDHAPRKSLTDRAK